MHTNTQSKMYTHVHLAGALLLALCVGCGGDAMGDTDGGTMGTETGSETSDMTAGPGSDTDGDCPGDLAFFDQEIWTPLASMTCISCHSPEGAAKGTSLVLQSADEEGYLQYNFDQFAGVALTDVDGESLLLLKPTGQHEGGHGGGMVVTPGTSQHEALVEFVARVRGEFECGDDTGGDTGVPSCEQTGGGPRMIRRLSHVEYNHSLIDLLGLSGDLAAVGLNFAPDNVVHGYTNNSDALLVSGLLADQYREVAETLAAAVVGNLGAYLGCDAQNQGEAVCAEQLVEELGSRAFRRPITGSEKARYMALYEEVAGEDGYEEGLHWVVAAMLQSPYFLYRTELGVHQGDGVYNLTAHEVASELSYLIVGTMPDSELLATADDGTLLDPDVLSEQANRLLGLAESRRTLDRFVEEWLGLTQLMIVTRDPGLYPELTPAIRTAMLGETHRLVADVFANGGSVGDLLTTNYTFATDGLQSFYGLPGGGEDPDPEGFKKVTLAGNTYGGLLTQGSVMTTHALPTSSSPIHRGKLVRERLFCQELPPPPPSLDTSPPPVDPDLSTRERYALHSSEPACAGCHDRIDPIGFGFEHFDAIGRWRVMDGVHEVDASGEVKQTQETDGVFDGALELGVLLSGSNEVLRCYAHQWAEFSLGVAERDGLECVQEDLEEALVGAQGRLDSLVHALVGAPHFVTRVGHSGMPVDPDTDTDTDTDSTGGDTSTTGDDTSTTGDDTTTSTTTGNDSETGEASEGVEFEVINDSSWPTGECNTVQVYNVSDAPVTWMVHLTLAGQMQNYWNAKATVDGLEADFVGEDYNAVIEPNGSTSFGFCVNF